ncbi:hypothetical protein [Winogradskyella aurantiaca]|uniref:hypothetical protein n=1 Tax=Winogradskyella aurantiaca TaxID=2219558 RepID=UPI000E1C8CD1|nr:hypothetical protein [Winogradskyella aurantiaca]
MIKLTAVLNKSTINLNKNFESELELIQSCQLPIVIGIVLVALFIFLLIITQNNYFKQQSRIKAVKWKEHFSKQYEDQRKLIEDYQLIQESSNRLRDRLIGIEKELQVQQRMLESVNDGLGAKLNQILNFVSASIAYSRFLVRANA